VEKNCTVQIVGDIFFEITKFFIEQRLRRTLIDLIICTINLAKLCGMQIFPARHVLKKYDICLNRISFDAFSFAEPQAKTTLGNGAASGALLISQARTGYWFSC
jgi:hypothetical protein